MLFEQPISTKPFRSWLREDPENRRLLWLSGAAIILQFIIFKFLYPFPNFMPPDSNSYMEAAFNNQSINMWAIGYSKFLRLFSSFTSSHIALVWFQYLLLETSLLYFLFSVRYLLSPGKWVFRILLGISVLNPLVPHISNFVGSDTLFTALSLIWFTQLFWILYRPTLRLLLWHAVIVLFVFMVRYNALYYPIISLIIIAFAHIKTKAKWLGIGSIVLLLGGFIASTEYAYYQETGTLQFSAFGGWQLAANALYGYAHAAQDPVSTVPVQFQKLHALVNQHMDTLSHYLIRPDHDIGVYYLWDFKSPLKVYMSKQWDKDTVDSYFKRWATMAPFYAAYGRYLIQHHPGPFIQYYLWPNLVKYYVPPTGFLGSYNIEKDHVDPIAKLWFRWKSDKVKPRFKSTKINLVDVFPISLAVVNFIFVINFIAFLLLGGLTRSSFISKRILLWMLVIWFSNMAFSVVAAPIELRYQLFPMMITIVFLGLLLSFLIAESSTIPIKQEKYNEDAKNIILE